MKPHIVADGERRLRRSPELKAQLDALREAVRARHGEELEGAGLFGRRQMAAEYRRERRKLEPTPGSLYGRRQVP